MLPIYYSPKYTLAKTAFDTTRKSGWIAESLVDRPINGVEIREPASLTDDLLLYVHTRQYIEAVKTGEPRDLAQSNGFEWDENFFDMVCASNGGVLEAALAARQHGRAGSLSSGLHHARMGHGDGYCTFNGLALAARILLATHYSVRNVLIIDLDAHCGGGTHSILRNESNQCYRHLDISTNYGDSYHPSPIGTLDVEKNEVNYMAKLRIRLSELDTLLHCRALRPFDLCLYNAGMDPYEGCSEGGMPGMTRDVLAARDRLVFDWCAKHHIPCAFVLAGGYIGERLTREELVDLHRITIEAAAR